MSNFLQQRQMSSGINYSQLQSKKKLQPITQSQQQQQQQQQLQLQTNLSSQQISQNSQAYAIQTQIGNYTTANGQVGILSASNQSTQGNSPAFHNNYYFGNIFNNNQQMQHQQQQQLQNSNKQLSNSSSPKSYLGQSMNSFTNSSGYIESQLGLQKQKSQNNGQTHSTQMQHQYQQQQQQQQQQNQQSMLSGSTQNNNQQPNQLSQPPLIQQQSNNQGDQLFSPNSMKNKKLYIDTNNNFYFSQQNAGYLSNLKQGGGMNTQSSQTQKGFTTIRKNQPKQQQRSPTLQGSQSPNLINQGGYNILSTSSPASTTNQNTMNYLNSSGQSNTQGQAGNHSLNLSNNSINSNNSQNVGIPYSDDTRFIKKTQHFIKSLTSQNGTWNGNNQEEIEDLDESVLEMMKECNLYEQAQKGIIPDADPTKFSIKRNGIVCCYAAKTHQGLVRNYNEDRVSIILNIMKPQNRQSDEQWPKCSFFGVYDGHGGVNCADFLRDHLHQYVIKDQNFPWNPKEAIKNGFEQAEIQFLKQAQSQINRGGQLDRSGSCALVVLIVGDTCYIANVGDSRAVMSQDGGKNIYALTRDHKPMDEVENLRIHENGGKVYQTKIQQISTTDRKLEDPQTIVGPYRVLPGRLSVTRTFGDIEAKLPRYGGNPKVVVSTPEIKSFKIQPNHDFIVMGCDGIYDKLTSQEIGQIVWDTTKNEALGENIHEFAGKSVENIMKLSIARKTLDNITVVMIGFDNIEKLLFDKHASSNEAQITQITQNEQSIVPIPSNSLTANNQLVNKNQKILQNISSSVNSAQSHGQNFASHNLISKNDAKPQTSIIDKKQSNLSPQLLVPLEKQIKNGNSLNQSSSSTEQTPLSEKDSNLENIEQKSTQLSYQSLVSRLPLSNQQKKRTAENSQEEVQTTSLKQLNSMSKTGYATRSSKVGLDNQNNSQAGVQLSPLYNTQQLSVKIKQQNITNTSQGKIQQINGIVTGETKFRQNLVKNLITK
ncbi:serine/threonine phosphatase 2C (macronuclear) [Tetrahymena thermophila SB210]|uniref:protein-serine/threonine phosphatase n=1 Tax=Tetrahymena thermophila (strain SB210) TaxID=312017 RepID=I7MM46_TETTS|nr:serine/threonine phosphatase 2C [Tetrahymena thermophila SB210]EAS03946.2 serine/threonine phosphatase 2C [Tetrahymena thermophila SB210]|eukprot:XP_001024191.2 serine/threonine phosphatase 2C [Tetrahymena thermophila SB210]